MARLGGQWTHNDILDNYRPHRLLNNNNEHLYICDICKTTPVVTGSIRVRSLTNLLN